MTRSLLWSELEPFDALMRLQNELERAFERPMGWFTTATSGRGVFPPANIFRRDDRYVVRLEVPGMPAEDVSVDAQLGALRVTGKRGSQSGAGTAHRVERWSGEFNRTIQLPQDADVAKASASYRNGVLSIEVPIREEAKPRKIAVQA
jgi:HSP20 family protein